MKNVKLKAIIFERGFTQRSLAKKTGIPEAHISMAIHGRYNLDREQQREISNALECNPGDVFEDEV